MLKLPQRQAQAFILREMEGLEGEEVCNLMGISLTNLRVMLYRARMRLQCCVELNLFVEMVEDMAIGSEQHALVKV